MSNLLTTSTFLSDNGYNLIRYPSENVKPYNILHCQPGKSKTLLFGNLERFIVSPDKKDFPPVHQDIKTLDIEGEKPNEFQIDFGLGFLEGVGDFLSALGSIGGELKIGYEKSRNVRYAYKNVSQEAIELGSLSNFLQDRVKPKMDSPFISFFNEPGRAFIITEILKSNQFEVEAYNEDRVGLEANINLILEPIGTDISVGRGSDSNTKLVYQGQNKIPFAFKAVPLWLDVSIPTFKIIPFEGINISTC